MKKNVASQKVGCQMITASDGSIFTGAVTVSVTGDAGTYATGSVGSGACTHEGGGYHTYAPAQAETNYDLVAFTFAGTGAVSATVQIYTGFPQTVDNETRLAAAATAIDTIDNLLDSEMPAVTASLAALTTAVDTIDNLLDTEMPAVTSSLAALTTAVDTIDNFLDTEMAAALAAVVKPTGTAVTGTLSATVFTTDLGGAVVADKWKDCWIKFTAGALANQVKKCTASSTASTLTFASGFTGAPSNGDAFIVINV